MKERFVNHRDVLRAAWWAAGAVRSVRRQLRRGPVDALRVAPPPGVPVRAGRGVRLILARLRPTCLERALVLQRWHAAKGRPYDVVVGVSKAGASFAAHAWIDVEEPSQRGEFREIARLAP